MKSDAIRRNPRKSNENRRNPETSEGSRRNPGVFGQHKCAEATQVCSANTSVFGQHTSVFGQHARSRTWISSDDVGFRRISLDFVGFRSVSSDFIEFHTISWYFVGFLRISKDFVRFLWISWNFVANALQAGLGRTVRKRGYPTKHYAGNTYRIAGGAAGGALEIFFVRICLLRMCAKDVC